MVINEIKGDMFANQPVNMYYVQCISADFKMGKGIATEFNKRFNTKRKLIRKYNNYIKKWDSMPDNTGGFCILEDNTFNLITKRNYWNKPTIDTLTYALSEMKKTLAEREDVKVISMPKIGCGLDRLNWQDVKKQIEKVFWDNSGLVINIYEL